MRITTALLLLLVLTACVSIAQPPQSRAEWEQLHIHTFPDKTSTEALDAAERVLRLADDEFTFDYPPGQLVGTRPWLTYMVITAAMGTDYWRITAKPSDHGAVVTVQISRAAGVVAPSPVVGAAGTTGIGVMSTSMPGRPIQFSPPYDLFWLRLEHQLGLRDKWTSCDEFKDAMDGANKAGLDVLCSVNTDDKAPAR